METTSKCDIINKDNKESVGNNKSDKESDEDSVYAIYGFINCYIDGYRHDISYDIYNSRRKLGIKVHNYLHNSLFVATLDEESFNVMNFKNLFDNLDHFTTVITPWGSSHTPSNKPIDQNTLELTYSFPKPYSTSNEVVEYVIQLHRQEVPVHLCIREINEDRNLISLRLRDLQYQYDNLHHEFETLKIAFSAVVGVLLGDIILRVF